MSNVETCDTDRNHLYPPFAAALHETLAMANQQCAPLWPEFSHWIMAEGYRSADRQDALFKHGRNGDTRDIVTWDRIPRKHGFGLAADCYPVDKAGSVRYDAPHAVYAQYGHCARANGLEWGGDWPGRMSGDVGHIQMPNVYKAEHLAAIVAYARSQGLTTPEG